MNKKLLVDIILEYLNVKDGEDFNIFGSDIIPSDTNPYRFKYGYLTDKHGNYKNNIFMSLVRGDCRIEKLTNKI